MRTMAALKGAFTLTAGLLLAALTVEVAARGYAFTPPDGATKIWNREGNAVSHWRDGVRVAASSHGAKRVLVLGDSYTAAQHVADDETFSFLAERQLRQAQVDVTLLNAGVPGTNLADHVEDGPALARKHAVTWSLVVFTDDDLGPASWTKSGTHFVREQGSVRVRRPAAAGSASKDALKPIRLHSAAVQNAYLQYKGFLEMAKGWHPFRATPPPRKPPPTKHYPVADALKLADSVFAGRVTFVHLGVGGSAVTPLERQFRAACAELNLHCMTTREAFVELRRSGKVPQGFPNTGWDVGHLNPWGHRVVAEVIGRALSNGLL